MRGAPLMIFIDVVLSGIIPACAGSTSLHHSRRMQFRDHPRMCGEHRISNWGVVNDGGSSPHVRGAPPCWNKRAYKSGIIPACAGSTWKKYKVIGETRDHPRMCGEHQSASSRLFDRRGSSPHVRGARRVSVAQLVPLGIIPACAGSTPSSSPTIA